MKSSFPDKMNEEPKKTSKALRINRASGNKPLAAHVSYARFVLIVGDDGAILVYLEKDTVVRRLFAPTASPEHTHAMTELIQKHPKAPVTLLMDVIDQQYTRHNFPPVSRFSVGGLVNRRLEREFAPEDIKGSIQVGRDSGARKDWIYLLVSLVNTANFQQWFDLLIEMPNRFAGIRLTPIETQHYIAALAKAIANRPMPEASWQLLISHHKVGGFRVVVLRDKKLMFTRVAQAIGEATPDILAGNVEQEIQNSIDYIRRLGYNENAGLEVFAIVAAEVRDAVDPKRVNASAIHLLSPYDAAELLGLKQAALTADRYGDVVIAAAISQVKKSALVLQTGYSKKLFNFYQLQKIAKITAVFLAVLFIALSLKTAVSAIGMKSQISKMTQATLVQTKAREKLIKDIDELGKDVLVKRDITIFLDVKKPLQYLPYDDIEEMRKLLRKNIKITDVNWMRTNVVASAQATDPSSKGPILIQIQLALYETFADNDSLISAIEHYKNFVLKNITRYDVEIKSSTGAGTDSKISVALGNVLAPSGNATTTFIDVSLSGPKMHKAENTPSNNGVAQ